MMTTMSWILAAATLCSALLHQTQGADCPQPATPLNAEVSVGGLTAGSLATYTCDPGYSLFGSDSVVCDANGKWTGKLPICATNVAYRKPVNQSSTARGGAGENANDGDLSTVHDGTRCTQTFVETSPWWAVDLLQQYEVSVVKVTARGCCGHEPLQDLEVRVGDSVHYHQNRLCAWLPGVIEDGTTRELQCARPMLGRYVMVQMVGVSGSMSLCEVQVYSTQEVSKERCSPDIALENLATFNRTCYHFQMQEGGTQEIAKKKCAAKNSTLVQHIQAITQDFLASELRRHEDTMTTKLLWVGVEKDEGHISRTWRWTDGTKVLKPLWGKEQPNNYIRDQNCVMMDGAREWLWNDVVCSLNYLHWICQFGPPSCGSPDKSENTTVAVKIETHAAAATDVAAAADAGAANAPASSGEVAVYSCPKGNMVLGDRKRTCGQTGLWEGEAPTCKYIDCKEPGSVENGKFVLLDSRTTYDARVLYECQENYTLGGSKDTITCGDQGTWDPPSPQCLFSWCDMLEAPRHGGLEVTGRRAGDIATFLCDPGYTMIGTKTVSCQLGGGWSGEPPTCRFVDCGIPDDIQHGEMTLVNGTTYLGSVSAYECDADYWLDGPMTRSCLKDGRWTGDRPYCILINCEQPEIPHDGYVIGYSFDVGSEVEYHCEDGHFLTGENIRVCTRDAIWSGSSPNCTYVDCGRVPTMIKGFVTYETEGAATYLDSTLSFECVPNHRLAGESVKTCMRDGKWTGGVTRCEEIRCRNPEVPDLARISVARNNRRLSSSIFRGKEDMLPDQTYRVSSSVTYRCDKGYVVEGSNLMTCLSNGTWSATAPSCKYVDCGHPDPIKPGIFRLLSNKTSYGSTVAYECAPNWRVEGKYRRFCQENGTWSGPTPKCIQILCSKLPTGNVAGLEVKEGTRTVGSNATYSCKEGYTLRGDPTRPCLQHGVWGGKVPSCRAVVCPEPRDIINGRRLKLNESTSFGTIVEYLCFPKYNLHGAFQLSCTQTGAWSHLPPKCTLDDTDYGLVGDNTVDGSSNSARGSDAGELDGSSNTGMYAGIVVSLLLVVAVALGLAFFRTRQRKLASADKGAAVKPSEDTNRINGAVTYGGLNDPTTGNNIYENIHDDLEPDPNYSELSTPPSRIRNSGSNTYNNSNGSNNVYNNGSNNGSNYSNGNNSDRLSGHTYSNGGGSVRDSRPGSGMGGYPPNQRPRMPPPQPPTVPAGVTINGMSIIGQ
uniref:CUB and sushi domain-containing protein 1-like n=2 Tax=Hirondellea gigas TaxID=1518452 RepID=A0A6A7FRK1_9CRUS